MATGHYLDFHQFNETYLHELRALDVTTEAHFVAYFSKILHNKLRRRLMCPEHIKDVQQETLLRAWAAVRAEGGIRQPERFGAFVSSVCNNILRESYRSRARTKPLGDLTSDPADQSPAPDGMLLAEETKLQVRRVLAKLPPKDRNILRAVFFEQRDKNEVCRELGVSREYLRVLLHRAKQQFVAEYKHVGGAPKSKVTAIRTHRKPATQSQSLRSAASATFPRCC
ncbi:MAG TPA: sigma-70 family RNA polymerase sigma factor [Candidatus Acidoferrales bacterium]|nr:sigma-70 family RNA polymerase sigma factor [Candidatus Acidoferrales bacterium]